MSSPEVKRARYTLRNRSVREKPTFEVPEWAGKNAINTCIVDSFLATLLCAAYENPSFSSLVKGDSKFTAACREFLEEDSLEMDERKTNFIKKLFKPNGYGEFDLEGDEAAVILDKAKEASKLSYNVLCQGCNKQTTAEKDYFYTGKETKSASEMLYTAITRLDRRHRCLNPQLCQNTEKKVDLKAFDTTWMLPFDISQVGWEPSKIYTLPPTIEVSEVKFKLRGVSLYGSAHYTSVLYDGSIWYSYDGMETPPLMPYSDFERIAFSSSTVKIAYYLRTNS